MDFEKLKRLREEVRNENWSVVEVIVDGLFHNAEQRLESSQAESKLPPLQEMENEILDALENLDILTHSDGALIGNRFATASAIYKVFKNKLESQ
jgi:hypothetical protein